MSRLFSRIARWWRDDLELAEAAAKRKNQYEAPVWHGDHWQNLLSSPIDARHYVLQDWNSMVVPFTDPHRAAA